MYLLSVRGWVLGKISKVCVRDGVCIKVIVVREIRYQLER